MALLARLFFAPPCPPHIARPQISDWLRCDELAETGIEDGVWAGWSISM